MGIPLDIRGNSLAPEPARSGPTLHSEKLHRQHALVMICHFVVDQAKRLLNPDPEPIEMKIARFREAISCGDYTAAQSELTSAGRRFVNHIKLRILVQSASSKAAKARNGEAFQQLATLAGGFGDGLHAAVIREAMVEASTDVSLRFGFGDNVDGALAAIESWRGVLGDVGVGLLRWEIGNKMKNCGAPKDQVDARILNGAIDPRTLRVVEP